MCFNQTGDISTLEGNSLKLVNKFIYRGTSVSSTEKDIDMRLTKTWTASDRLSIIWKSDLTDKMKLSFFQAAVMSILLYGCTTWTLAKRLEKKLDGNYTRMLRAILNKSGRQHPTKHQLYGHLPPLMKTIQARRTRHAGHCWRSRDVLISDALLWTPTYSRAKAGRPGRTYIQQLCEDTGCSPEDLPWTIGRSGERGAGISVLAARHNYDIYIYIYIYIGLVRDLYSLKYHKYLSWLIHFEIFTFFSLWINKKRKKTFAHTYIHTYLYLYKERVCKENYFNTNKCTFVRRQLTGFVWLLLMPYQLLQVIKCQTHSIHIYQIYMVCKQICR